MAMSKDEPYKFHHLIEKISDCYPAGTPEYHHVCFLSAKALDKGIPKSSLCRNQSLSTIFNDNFNSQPDGRAYFWYILEISGCSNFLQELRGYIGSVSKVNPSFQLRVLLSKIASKLDPNEWSKLINTVGKILPYTVEARSLLSSGNMESIITLLKFFEKVEQQCVIKHDNVEKLCGWLKDIGRQDLIEDHIASFDSSKPIRVTGEKIY